MTFIHQDFETRSLADLTVVGGLKYALDASTHAMLWSWGLDDDPIKLWCPDLSADLVPEVWAYVKSRMSAIGVCPAEVVEALKKPDTYLVGWNEPFDFKVWRQVVVPDHNWPDIRPEQTLDAMAQAQASNLPGSLDFAGRALGLGTKTIGGKAIMKRFADAAQPLPGAPADIAALMAKGLTRERAVQTAIDAWALYLDYSVQDTELMRDVWKCTRPLDAQEWQEYWVSERINDRGMLADLDVCRGAASYHIEEAEHVVEQVKQITGGAIAGPSFTAQINQWVYDRLPDDLAELMVKKRDDEGYVTNLTGDKTIMTRLLEEFQTSDTPPADEVVDLIEVLQFGRSSSALKFQKILDQEVDGRLTGSYVFNGAGQTGRFSSRGVQVHNLPRDYLKNELDVLDMIAAGLPIENLRAIGPVSAVLAKLIRPTFMAPPGKTLVWGDWSAIEARVTPWLAASRDAEEAVLAPFRQSDVDGSKPDLYVLNAASIFHVPADVIWERYKNGDPEAKAYRQGGKVACIAEGQQVLTDIGLVPIEQVTLDMKVWDGQSFVSHQGSVFMGYKDVYEYDGLIATLDHIIWTEEAGETRFGEAIRRGYHHVKSGAGRAPIRVGGDRFARTAVPATEVADVLCFMPVYELRRGEIYLPGEPSTREIARLPALHETSPNTEMAGPPAYRREKPMHQSDRQKLPSVRGARDRVSFSVGDSRRRMDTAEPGSGQKPGNRPDRQHGPLRAWESALGDRTSATSEQARFKDRGELGLYPERVALRLQHGTPETLRGVDAGGDYPTGSRRSYRGEEGMAYYRGKVAVYDIANAGPLHRFTVSDCLVHNCLALGFRGSVGALKAMAKNYGIRLSNEEAKTWVDGWRDRNRWNKRFGVKCEEAAFSAMARPGDRLKAGRLTYQFLPGLMGGTLVCYLPDGRPIVYPKARISKVEKFGKEQDAITYLNGMGRRHLWDGLQIENGTQATAASILRQTLVRLDVEEKEAEIVLHTHDEVGGEVDEAKASGFAERLHGVMVRGFDWTEGLPLAAEVSTSWYYTKGA